MILFVKIMLVISMVAILVTLVMGSRAFLDQGAPDRSISNKWMQRRIMAQTVAVFLIAMIFFLKRTGG